MIQPPFPICWRKDNKPHKFDPGCGHGSALKALGFVIDELGLQNKTVLGFDIGCSLLAWDLFDVDSIQTHHGRTIPVMVGFKKANPKAICLAYLGDGGAYAIGAQHLINSAMRNDNLTVIVINNANYGMTGGQEAPTTLPGQITTTTPYGADKKYIQGPEMITSINQAAYLARGTVANPEQLKTFFKRAFEHQLANRGFSLVEVLSRCPVNWKTNAKETWQFLEKKMAKYFKIGEIQK